MAKTDLMDDRDSIVTDSGVTLEAARGVLDALDTLCRTYDPDGSMTPDEMIDTTLDLLLHGRSAS